jgi:hypothetical protein
VGRLPSAELIWAEVSFVKAGMVPSRYNNRGAGRVSEKLSTKTGQPVDTYKPVDQYLIHRASPTGL